MRRTSQLAAVLLLAFADTVSGNCTVNVSGTSFGFYDPSNSTPTDSSGEIILNCTVGTAYIIKLDEGINSKGSYFPRRMRSTSGISTLDYNLYRDVIYNEVWGDGWGGTYTRSGSGTGYTETLVIYGRIIPYQNVADGVYTDAISVLVEF